MFVEPFFITSVIRWLSNHVQMTLAPRESYGVDVSWPMHHLNVSSKLGNRGDIYKRHMDGCYEFYNFEDCNQTESDRIAMNLRQPQSMVNYTKNGYQKIRTPEKLFRMIEEFWQANKDYGTEEEWFSGNTYVNHWVNHSLMVSVENTKLKGGGNELRDKIWSGAEEVVRNWTDGNLETSSLYGIRVYKEGAILATHVDRLPLVSSAIINVDQDVDEPWVLEVIGHDKKAHNVTMVPGDMVLYESHSILHGRPFALKGRFMANLFIHFAPVETTPGRPPYVIEGSPEDLKRMSTNGYGTMGYEHVLDNEEDDVEDYVLHDDEEDDDAYEEFGEVDDAYEEFGEVSHYNMLEALFSQDFISLEHIAENDLLALFRQDINGWSAIHEAAREDDVMVIQFLLEKGDDVLKKTCSGDTASDLAKHYRSYESIHFLNIVELEKIFDRTSSILDDSLQNQAVVD